MATKLPKLRQDENFAANDNSEAFVADLGKVINKNFKKIFDTSTAMQMRMIDDTLKSNAANIAINQEEYAKNFDRIKTTLSENTLDINKPLSVELIDFDVLLEKMDVLTDIVTANNDKLLNATNAIKPSIVESPAVDTKKVIQDNEKDRSIFGKFFSMFRSRDARDRMGTNRGGGTDFLKAFGNFFAVAMNPTEYFNVAGRKVLGALQGLIVRPLVALISGVLGFVFNGLLGITQVIIGSLFSGTLLKAGMSTLASVFSRINPIALILTGIGALVYDTIQGWINTEGSNTDKALGAIKNGLLGGGLFKVTGKWAAMGAAIGSFMPVIGTLAGALVGGIIGVVIGLVGGDVIAGWVDEAWTALKGFGMTAYQTIEDAYNNVSEFVSGIGDWFVDKYTVVTNKIDEIKADISNFIEEWKETFIKYIEPITNFFKGTAEFIRENFTFEGVTDALNDSIQWFSDTFNWIATSITGWFDDKLKSLRNLKNRVLGIFGMGDDVAEEIEAFEPVNTAEELRKAEEKAFKETGVTVVPVNTRKAITTPTITLPNQEDVEYYNSLPENPDKIKVSLNRDRELASNPETQYVEGLAVKNNSSVGQVAIVGGSSISNTSTNVVTNKTTVQSVPSPVDRNSFTVPTGI